MGNAVYYHAERQADDHFRWSRNDGVWFPGAVGAKIGAPDKDVVCITGDGGMQMNMQEMATAICEKVPLTICILNNNYLGMVRQMQQLFYGKRYEITCLRRQIGCPDGCKGPNEACPPYVPDFVKWAESYGAAWTARDFFGGGKSGAG